MNDCRLGYYFARIKGTADITTVGCWGDKVEKTTPKDVEILEKVPPAVISCCSKGVKVLNLQRILTQKERT